MNSIYWVVLLPSFLSPRNFDIAGMRPVIKLPLHIINLGNASSAALATPMQPPKPYKSWNKPRIIKCYLFFPGIRISWDFRNGNKKSKNALLEVIENTLKFKPPPWFTT